MSAASTGLPAASASRAGSPKPSSIEGSTSARAPATRSRSSASVSQPVTCTPAPSARSTSRPAGPASTRSGVDRSGPAARHGPARSRCRFLRGSREPTKTRYSSGRPRDRSHADVAGAASNQGASTPRCVTLTCDAGNPYCSRTAAATTSVGVSDVRPAGQGTGTSSRYSRLASLTVCACSSYVRSCTVTTSRAWRVGGETKLVPWNTSVVPTRSSTGGQEPRRHSDRTSRAGTRRPTWVTDGGRSGTAPPRASTSRPGPRRRRPGARTRRAGPPQGARRTGRCRCGLRREGSRPG